eukprot:3542970-Rhodomonas_salina.1
MDNFMEYKTLCADRTLCAFQGGLLRRKPSSQSSPSGRSVLGVAISRVVIRAAIVVLVVVTSIAARHHESVPPATQQAPQSRERGHLSTHKNARTITKFAQTCCCSDRRSQSPNWYPPGCCRSCPGTDGKRSECEVVKRVQCHEVKETLCNTPQPARQPNFNTQQTVRPTKPRGRAHLAVGSACHALLGDGSGLYLRHSFLLAGTRNPLLLTK